MFTGNRVSADFLEQLNKSTHTLLSAYMSASKFIMPIIQFLSILYKFHFMLKYQDENRSVYSYMFATVTLKDHYI